MLGLQIVFSVCLFVFVALSYLIPVMLTRGKLDKHLHSDRLRVNQIISSCCICTSAGVFIAMFFLGLLPNVRNKLLAIFQRMDIETDFPATECLVVLGYFLTLTIHQLMLICRKRSNQILLSNSQEFEQRKSLLNEFELDNLSPTSVSHDEINFAALPDTSKSITVVPGKKGSSHNVENHNRPPNKSKHSHMLAFTENTGCLNFVVLVMATSVHALFEGATLALQTTTQRALHLFIAILVHECLVALALGINTTRLKMSISTVVKFALLFSLALPTGVGIGLAIGHTPGVTGDIISAIVQGIAAGTFLHITFQELIPSEFNVASYRLLKLLFLFFGFTFFAIVTFLLMDS